MKIFANTNIWKKIVIIFMLMFTVSVVEPKPVEAGIGGELMKPVCDLVVGLGDAVMKVTHRLVLHQQLTLIRVEKDSILATVIKVVIVVAIVIACIVAIAASYGAATAPATFVLSSVVGFLKAGAIIAGVAVGSFVAASVGWHVAEMFGDEVALPIFSITPETIFTNKMPLFDANFINPKKDVMTYRDSEEDLINKIKNANYTKIGSWTIVTYTDEAERGVQENTGMTIEEFKQNAGYTSYVPSGNNDGAGGTYYYCQIDDYLYRFYSGTDGVGTGEMRLEKTNEVNFTEESEALQGEIHALSYDLQKTVSKWYNILRTIAIVGMMSVLVYIGIRILISSTAPQKAKYKEMLKDWLVGMVLLFTMHYIMNFANIFTEQLTELLGSVNSRDYIEIIPVKAGKSKNIDVLKALADEGVEPMQEMSGGEKKVLYQYIDANGEETEDSSKAEAIAWHTGLMGAIRINAGLDGDSGDESFIGYSIMYAVMIIYTIVFCFTYIKRVIYLAFLTMIAPLVALTYPIDKVNDGQAQGFNTWFKEYMFNLLLQPMHLLIYTVLVSAALDFVGSNWIYSLVAIGFITTAEKIIRTLFNFQKAKTPGALAGPAGAALMMTGMKNVLGLGPKGSGAKEKGGADGSSSSDASGKAKMKTMDSLGGLIAGGSSGGSGGSTSIISGSGGRGATPRRVLSGMTKKKPITNRGGNGAKRIKAPAKAPALAKGTTNTNNAKAKGGSIRQGLANAWGAEKNRFSRKIKNAKPIRNLVRTAGGAFMGATAGTIGLAAGIASGDPNKAFQYATLGMAGGYKFGAGVGDKLSDSAEARKGTIDQFERGRLGEAEYKKRENKKKKEEYKRDDKLYSDFQKLGYTRKEYEDIIDEHGDAFINAKVSKGEIADVYASIDSEFVTVDNDGNVDSTSIKDLDQAISLYQVDKMFGGIQDKDERINAIMDTFGVTRATAENFDSGRIASNNSRKGFDVGNTNIEEKMQAKREEIEAERRIREQREYDEQLDRQYKEAVIRQNREKNTEEG